ncbi:MAG: hypothetical protein HKM98_01105 [Gammaproteobacteria bacterium]|nr:hypothetical protein [Gammaproteobacteria bacterium]
MNPNRSWGDLVFGLLFIIGGLITIFYVKRVLIDTEKNKLISQEGVILPLRNKRYAIDKIRAISISVKSVRSNNKERTTFPVRLSGIKDSVILNHKNPWFSRVIAEQLARLMKVPLVNRVYGTTTTREPDDLDTPLIERWRREGKRFEKPSRSYDSDLQESAPGQTYILWLRAEMPQLKYLIGLLWLLVIPAVLDVAFAEVFHSTAYRITAVIFAVAGVMLLSMVGRSKLTISGEKVTFRQGYFPLKASLRMEAIEELIVAGDGITLIGDTNAVWVHWGTSKQDSDYLEAVIPYQIQRLSVGTLP